MSTPAVIYAAKSTEDKRGSIGTQLQDGRSIAADNGWTVLGEFEDEAKSAYSGNRGDGLAQAMALCERLRAEQGSCKLIVQHSDRLARGDGTGARHLVHYVLWAREHGVDIVSKQDPEMVAGEYAIVMGAIGGMRNNEDSKRKGQSVKDGMERRARRGQPPGGPAAYGYRWRAFIGDDGEPRKRRVIDQREAAVVRRIFAEFIAGRSQCQITRDLNADGISTVRGGKWYQGSVAKLLRCALYVGKFSHYGEILDTDELEPIVDPDTWSKAQALLARSSEDTGEVDARGRRITRGRGRAPAGRHLFRKGMLRCSCGSPMTPFTRPNRTPGAPPYEAYVCLGRKNGLEGPCSQPAVRRELIDPAVWAFFERVALDTEATREAIVRAHDDKLAELAELRHQADRDQLQAQARLARVESDYLDGKIGAEAWQRFSAKLGADLDAATAQLTRLDAQREALTDDLDRLAVEAAVVEEMAALRAQITGEVRKGAEGGSDALRAALARVFSHFQLVPRGQWPSAVAGPGIVYPDADDLYVDGYWLIPYVRPEAMDWTRFEPERVALDGLSAFDENGLTM